MAVSTRCAWCLGSSESPTISEVGEILSWTGLIVGIVAIPIGVLLRPRRPAIGEVLADLGVALTTGAFVAIAIFYASERAENNRQQQAERLNDRREEQDERRENLRFIRALSDTGAASAESGPGCAANSLPLGGIDLRGQHLDGLGLLKPDLNEARLDEARLNFVVGSCTILIDADLICTDLFMAVFRGPGDFGPR